MFEMGHFNGALLNISKWVLDEFHCMFVYFLILHIFAFVFHFYRFEVTPWILHFFSLSKIEHSELVRMDRYHQVKSLNLDEF